MQQKNNSVLAIFAHPDDEAFGPAGTLAKFTKTHDVYILCTTKGEKGQNDSNSSDLASTRAEELKKSAQILGAKDVLFLGFADGSLCNNNYHKLAEKIEEKIEELKPEVLITFDTTGMTGHLDHIAVSLVTTYVHQKSKLAQKLMYYCMLERESEFHKNYFIYFPKGYKKEEVEEVVDVSEFWQKKIDAIKAHISQKDDVENALKVLEKLPKEENFLIFKA